MANLTATNRLTYIDVLKSIAIIGVLIIHSTSTAFVNYAPLSLKYFYTVLPSCIARISVPLFVMCSGVVFLNKHKEITVRQIYGRYILRIVAALVLFAIFYEIVNVLEFYSYTGVFDLSLMRQGVDNLLKFNTYFHLYYLYIVIILYALVPVLKIYLKASSRKNDFYLLCFLFVTANLLPSLRMYFPFNTYFGGMTLQYSLNLVYGMISYFFLGYYLASYDISKRKQLCIIALGVVGAFITFAGNALCTLKTGKLEENYINATNVYIYFMSAAVFLVCKKACQRLNSAKISSVFAGISNSSFTIYLIHQAYNILFARLGLSLSSFTPFLSFPLIVIANFILSFITHLVLKKIPLLKRLV